MRNGDATPDSFWRTTSPAPAPVPLSGDRSADVAVVGAGFTGLSTALELRRARPDLRVVVLEAETVGFGASGRNAGFSMTLFGLEPATTALRFGKRRVAEAFVHMQRCVQNLHEVVEREEIDCDYEANGLLVVATCKAHLRRLEREVRLFESLGIDTLELWDAERVKRAVASERYRGAKYDPDCALLNPWKLVHGLARAARARGVEVYEHAPVTKLERRPDEIRLHTPSGVVSADKVVLATNAYADWLGPLHRRSLPAYTYIVTTEPLADDVLGQIGWVGRHGIEDARQLVHYYRLTADNRLLIGGGQIRYAFGGRPKDPALVEHPRLQRALQRTARDLFPALEDVEFAHHWGGPVSVPLDLAPAIGALGRDRRVFYSLGCVGHGVSLTVMNGRVLTELLLGEDTELTRLFFVDRRVLPFPPEPLRFVAAHTIRGALSAIDRLQVGKPSEPGPS